MINLNSYIGNAIFYSAYLIKVEEDIKQQKPLFEHSRLNLVRMKRINKTFTFTDEQLAVLKTKNSNFSLLVISEGWCGDASQILPIINAIANELRVEMKIVFRDENEELMNKYLFHGAKSIPIIIGINTKLNEELFHWGPRTKAGTQLLKEYKENPTQFSKEYFHKRLQSYYNENKGKDIFNEFVQLNY